MSSKRTTKIIDHPSGVVLHLKENKRVVGILELASTDAAERIGSIWMLNDPKMAVEKMPDNLIQFPLFDNIN